jgi:heat shock protein HslJ
MRRARVANGHCVHLIPITPEKTVSRVLRLSLLIASVLSACASQPPRPVDLAGLVGTWKLAAHIPAGARIPTLSVQRDGSIAGTSGVNRYQARLDTAALAQGNFVIGPPAGTRMMGAAEAMQLESDFLQALQAADRAVMEDQELVLKRGELPLLRFDRVSGG